MDTIVAIQGASSKIDHLDFNERAVRDGLLAVSNDGSIAHAIRDSDGELAVHSWSKMASFWSRQISRTVRIYKIG